MGPFFCLLCGGLGIARISWPSKQSPSCTSIAVNGSSTQHPFSEAVVKFETNLPDVHWKQTLWIIKLNGQEWNYNFLFASCYSDCNKAILGCVWCTCVLSQWLLMYHWEYLLDISASPKEDYSRRFNRGKYYVPHARSEQEKATRGTSQSWTWCLDQQYNFTL